MEKFECNDSELIVGQNGYRSFLDSTWRHCFFNDQLYENADVIRRNYNALSKYSFLKDFDLDVKALRIIKRYQEFKEKFHEFVIFVDRFCVSNASSLEKGKKQMSEQELGQVLEKGMGVLNLALPGIIPTFPLSNSVDISKYSDKELADMVIRGEFGAGDTRKKALGNRYSNVQKIVNQRMSGSVQTTTKQTTTTTSVKETSTGANTTKAGTSSELEKRLKEKEVELENAEIAKRKAIAAESEAQDKLNRAKAEQKDLDKKMVKLASEKEDAQIEAEQLKTENEELRKKLEEKTTPIKVEPQPEPQPEPTPEPQLAPQPEPQPTPQPQAQPRTYTETQVSQPAASQTPPVEVKPSEQPVVEEPKTATEVQPTTPKQDTGSSLPNPNAGSTDTGTGSSSSSKGSSVVPIAVGLGAAVAGGIGIKAIHDHRKNSKFDDQNEDSVTNGNRFWTEEDPNVIHTEEDLFNDESSSNSENVSYQAVENNTDNSDTWNIEESEISDDNTFDLLSENN